MEILNSIHSKTFHFKTKKGRKKKSEILYLFRFGVSLHDWCQDGSEGTERCKRKISGRRCFLNPWLSGCFLVTWPSGGREHHVVEPGSVGSRAGSLSSWRWVQTKRCSWLVVEPPIGLLRPCRCGTRYGNVLIAVPAECSLVGSQPWGWEMR